MTDKRVHGHTRSGALITDSEVQALADEAEAGYDVDRLLARRAKRGRPSLGSSPASVESVRLDPELRSALLERAQADGTTPSEIMREALRRFLCGTKGSGFRVADVLEVIRANPGMTIPEIAERMGIKQDCLYRVLPLVESDALVEVGRGPKPNKADAAE